MKNENILFFEEVNNTNLDIAIKIQKEIFPLENGSDDLKTSITNNIPNYQFLQKYYLAKNENRVIGISGLYAYKAYPQDAWLRWFGVIDSERGKGYATQILKQSIQKAKEMGFETLRLYTDEEDNANAVKLYKKFGMVSEFYDNPDDKHFEIGKTLIFSISLNDKKVTPWNNKNLYLGLHDERNN